MPFYYPQAVSVHDSPRKKTLSARHRLYAVDCWKVNGQPLRFYPSVSECFSSSVSLNSSRVLTTVTGRPESCRKERNRSMGLTGLLSPVVFPSLNHSKWSAGITSVSISSVMFPSAEARRGTTSPNKCSSSTAGYRRKNSSHSVLSEKYAIRILKVTGSCLKYQIQGNQWV